MEVKSPDKKIGLKIDLKEFHPKIQQLFRGKESKLRMIDNWVLMETLGMGGYSKVKLGLEKTTGKKAALKCMFAESTGKISNSKKKQLMRELNVMKKVNHPNVIKLISFNADAKYPEANGKYTSCIMTALEFAAGGELFDYLMYTGHFDDIATRSYFKQLISGLNAMHSVGIAHRDLKPENLLMDSSFTLKIADFGFATEFIDSESGKIKSMKTPCGTKNYLAPEFWKGEKYSHKADIFACGIILFTTYAGFPPFMEAQPKDWWWDKYSIALEKLRRANELRALMKKNPSLANSSSSEKKEMESCIHDARKRMQLFWKAHSKKRHFDDDDFKDIALNLIHPNPNRRMEIKQIMSHKWYIKGPLYTNDELRLYLTKRVKTVLQGRARKIRKLMQEQQGRYNGQQGQHNAVVRPIDGKPTEAMVRRMNEIDPKKLFDKNIQYIKDEIFPNTIFQFITDRCPTEIAVRLEIAATKYAATINIIPQDNLVTISAGYVKDIYDPLDETKKIDTQSEKIVFCVKQLVINKPEDEKEKNKLLEEKK
eukprot:47514_1